MLIMRMIRICDYNFIIFQKKVLRQRAPRNLTTDGTPDRLRTSVKVQALLPMPYDMGIHVTYLNLNIVLIIVKCPKVYNVQ